jgi:hypothetical protein
MPPNCSEVTDGYHLVKFNGQFSVIIWFELSVTSDRVITVAILRNYATWFLGNHISQVSSVDLPLNLKMIEIHRAWPSALLSTYLHPI